MVAKSKIKKVVAVSAVSVIGFVGVGTASVSYAQESVAESSAAITNFRSTYQSKDRVVLTWDKVPGAVGYVLDYTEKYPDTYDNDTMYLEGTSNWYTWQTDPGVELEFTIQPYFGDDVENNFVGTEVLQVSTKGIPPVANLENPTYSDSTATLEWEKTSDNVGKYLIQRQEEDGTYSKVRTIYSNDENLSYTVKNLASESKYGFRVTAVDGTGDRSAPQDIGVETLPAPPEEVVEVTETPISGLRSTHQSKDRIVVTWDKKSAADGYKVVWFGAGTDNEDFDIIEENWFTIETRSGQKNDITIIPWYGNSSKYSERASISVTSKGQTAVSKLTASEIDETTVQLRWLTAGEDVKYLVRGRQKDGSYAKIATVVDNSETVEFLVDVDKLQAGDFDLANPEYKVIAVNAEGEQSSHMVVTPGQQARVQ